MIKSQESRDFELARKLYQEDNYFGLTENAILPKNNKENYKPRTLIDQTLELIDPTPNIYTLFMQFNERFFWNVLLPVEVKWSPRMTSCAGVCTFHPRNRQCVISLSAPLLKLRPRKDLVETLLHEMIHGYLFLTNNNRDRDGHGPEFCKHMNRINKEAGTKITIYHSFNDEVKLYQQHWWRCNGPCRERAPYFGIVRRAMNRAPGPNDYWWQKHQQICGGQYTKIKEPENYKAKTSKNKEKANLVSKNNISTNNLFDWLKKPNSTTASTATPIPINVKPLSNTPDSLNKYKRHSTNTNNVQGWGVKGPNSSHKSIAVPTDTFTPTKIKPVSNNPDLSNGFKKLGTSTNSVHGWGVRGPTTDSNNSQKFISTPLFASTPEKIKPHSNTPDFLNRFKKLGNNTNNVHGWGTGGPNGSNNTQKSTSLISNNPKFSSSGTLGGSTTGRSNLLSKFDNRKNRPDFNRNIKVSKEITGASTVAKAGKSPIDSQSTNMVKLVECPICSNFVPSSDIDKHVDSCLIISDNISSTKAQVKVDETSSTQKRKINMSTFSSKQPKLDQSENIRVTNCPVCDKSFEYTSINEHLDKCLLDANEQDNSTIKLDNKNVASEMKNESIISISSTSTSSNSSSFSITEDLKDLYSKPKPQKKNAIDNSQKCLVCNMFIPPEMSLNDHLEDCIGNLFNDDSELSIDYVDVKMSEKSPKVPVDQNNRYLCPVCTLLISESFMNQHLDECLKNT
ncbi:DNA-dependent metalloprotease SPRTN isoform X2 [Hylaeus anthracinus]|uniref:DNA-dependent metalloprotease SPRTN isoform X2 n=1 Tax=Hylaeus anthracinus TaxID=313031 RepID=UPI0023B90242|nr:DNA-dependent metalloprotease SPRTN isoform X2 [Hylaeus anthracinus]